MCRTITSASSLCLRLLIVVVTLVGVVGFSGEATADTGTCPAWAAKVVSIEGQVEAMASGDTQWRTVALNDTFCPDDQIRTLENSRAALQLSNETILRLDQNTLVKLSANKPESPSLLEIFTGRALFMTRFPHPLTIETPYMNAHSGGTEYVIEVDKEHQTSTLTVIEGTMHINNTQGSLTVTDGQSSVTRSGEKPTIQLMISAKDVLHWALYYPPVLNIHDLNLGTMETLPDTDWRAMIKKSITAYEAGDLKKAFAELSHASTNIDDSRFYAYRASLLLAVGRVEQAQTDIEQSLKLAAHNGLALSLQSIIAVVQNHPDKALSLAQQAANAAPDSAGVRIALSYAWQSTFHLAQALTAAQDATHLDPKSALAWARTAELWLSQGYLTEALDAAKRAEALKPHDARVHTILGFAYLTQLKAKQAHATFEQAIALNSSDPLPRLGLGLAKIRQGKLSDGRKEIEIAAALNPGNSLIRSYLGKAYYEEKRDDKAAIQFDLAKKRDPKDPTPYSYDAVRKQTTNRPIEALDDVETAIKLNDNRAVYRSRLLLDSDLASRSVRRGQIDQDLGFGQRALVEALQSVNTDPMNYSAQRFLADSYATLPESAIARQSALLTSQLLQPVNNNPVQPSLSNDSIVSSGMGALSPSFNEYSQLFDSNGIRLLASGIGGEQNTKGDELTLNGVHNRFSWSLGQYRYDTDGFRENADIHQKIYDVYLQGQVAPKLSIQGEARLNKNSHGYLGLNYDPTVYSSTYNKDQTDRTYRLGAHFMPTPASSVLVSAFYQRHTENMSDMTAIGLPPGSSVTAMGNQMQRVVEAQYLVRLSRVTITSGAGYYNTGRYDNIGDVYIVLPLPPPFNVNHIVINEPNKIRHANLYVYSLIAVTKHLQLSIGASADSVQDKSYGNHKQFNPKLGLMWDISSAISFRVVGTRSLNRDIVSNQTIEPTQVAGFQQFFEDIVLTDSKLYGIGLDHKFSAKTFSGLEFTRRKAKYPTFDTGTNSVVYHEEKYSRGRAYLDWTPLNRVAVSMDYYYEHIQFDPSINSKPTTQRVPLGIKYFHPSGFFVGLTASYIDQSGSYVNPVNRGTDPLSSKFWLIDATVGYRLPRQRGIFSVGIQNLTDRQFHMNETERDPDQFAPLQPRRFVYGKLTLNID